MVHATYSEAVWPAPVAPGPLAATVRLPGSKSLTNRELVLSALSWAVIPGQKRLPFTARSRPASGAQDLAAADVPL